MPHHYRKNHFAMSALLRSGLAATLRSLLLISLAVAITQLSLAPRSWAAPPPGKKVCDSTDVFERIKCRQGGIVDQVSDMVENKVKNGAIGLSVSEEHTRQMEKQEARIKFVDENSTPANFKALSEKIHKNNKNSCELAPLDPADADGICSPELGEECAAEDDPTLPCDPKLKRKNPNKPGLVCAQNCETTASQTPAEEQQDVEAVAEDLEDAYDAMEDNLMDANGTLDNVNVILGEEALAARLASDDPCANIAPLPEGLEASWYALHHAWSIADTAKDVMNVIGHQTIVAVVLGSGGGGNSSWLSMPLAIGSGALEEAYYIVNDIVSAKRSEFEKNTFACLQLAKATGDASAQMLVDLQGQVGEVIRLLNTPQGLRPGFPKATEP